MIHVFKISLIFVKIYALYIKLLTFNNHIVTVVHSKFWFHPGDGLIKQWRWEVRVYWS